MLLPGRSASSRARFAFARKIKTLSGRLECQDSKDLRYPARATCRSAFAKPWMWRWRITVRPISQFTIPLLADLKKIFRTETGQVFVFPGSGTGGWEAAIANTLSPGDSVLAAVFGQFSLLWVDLCQRFGLEVDPIEVEWGKGLPLDQYRARLEADKQHKIKAVLVTHNETATGVTSNVAGVRAILDDLGTPHCCSSTASARLRRSIFGWKSGALMLPSPARKRVS